MKTIFETSAKSVKVVRKIENPEVEPLMIQMSSLAGPEFIQINDAKETLLKQTTKSTSEQYCNYNHVNWRLSSHFEDAYEDLIHDSDMSIPIVGKPDSFNT
jgi:hypothetical protein